MRPAFAGATNRADGFDSAGSGTYAGVDAPKSRSPIGWSQPSHSVGTKTLAALRVNDAMPVRRTTSWESEALRGTDVVSPVTPKTLVPSDARPPDPQIPDLALCVVHPATRLGLVMFTATIHPWYEPPSPYGPPNGMYKMLFVSSEAPCWFSAPELNVVPLYETV